MIQCGSGTDLYGLTVDLFKDLRVFKVPAGNDGAAGAKGEPGADGAAGAQGNPGADSTVAGAC